MKTLWIILLTMVMFNGFLFAFSSFFPQSPLSVSSDATDVTSNQNLTRFSPGQFTVTAIIGDTASLGILFAGIGATILSRNLQYVAASGLIAIVTQLWTQTANVFASIMNQYAIVGAIYSLIAIAIGIITAVLIIGIFTGQDQTGV